MGVDEKKRVLAGIFLMDKPTKILLDLKGAQGRIYATILSKDANCTYSHTIKILNIFKKLGLVDFDKKGRIKTVKLTDAGWEIAHALDAASRKLDETEDAIESSGQEREGRPADKKAEKKGPRGRARKTQKE